MAAASYLALLTVFLVSKPPALGAAAASALLVVAIVLARVHLGMHHPTDVAAGVLFGATWSFSSRTTLERGRSSTRMSERDGLPSSAPLNLLHPREPTAIISGPVGVATTATARLGGRAQCG